MSRRSKPGSNLDGPFVKEADPADFDEERKRVARAGGIGVGLYLVLDAPGRFSEHAGAAMQPTQQVVRSKANRPRQGGKFVGGRDRCHTAES